MGQMLNKICIADGIDLVNVVRKPEQEEILRGIGAKYVLNSSSHNFMEDLIEAISDTGATLAFDAIGGGVARYHYGIDKQRTRKHIERNSGSVEDRIYLGGYELYRRRNASDAVTFGILRLEEDVDEDVPKW